METRNLVLVMVVTIVILVVALGAAGFLLHEQEKNYLKIYNIKQEEIELTKNNLNTKALRLFADLISANDQIFQIDLSEEEINLIVKAKEEFDNNPSYKSANYYIGTLMDIIVRKP